MQYVDLVVTGGTILTLDSKSTKIKNGAVAIRGDTIVALGSEEEIKRSFVSSETLEVPQSIIMPGLINGHTHAAMTCFRGLADDMELMSWLNDFIFPAEARNVDPELAYWGSLLACAEMIRSGTTTFCDMYIFEDETGKAAKKAGMRCLIGEVLFDFPSPNVKNPKEGLQYTENLIKKWADDPLVNILVEPHALYTCSADLIKASYELARRHNVPLGIHLLENRAEAQQLEMRFGKRATSYLKELGVLWENFIAFHCVAMDEEDMKIFSDYGCKIVHNPQSNMKLTSGAAPVSTMLRYGIKVGLGTDGAASNNNLDMFEEMDTASKLAKVSTMDPTVLPAETVIRMATSEGAKVLGMSDKIGSLEVGKKADIIVIDTHKPHLTPLYNEYSHLVYAANGSDVDTVIINGRVVMKNRELTTIDEDEVMEKVKEIAIRITRSLS